MRGKVGPIWGRYWHNGITPAYAGKSWLFAISAGLFWDHPRVCGEKFEGTEEELADLGSPPRMRGKDHTAIERNTSDRITPAYAGKSQEIKNNISRYGDHPRVCGEKTKKIP